MLVKSLKLNNYRNYSNYSIEFNSTLNIIVGKNGVGKTNILESIIVVSNTKSFRTMDDTDLIKKNEEFARISLQADEGDFKVIINNQNKSLYLNNNSIKKTSEYIGKLNAILFKPLDLQLFTQAPSERRKLLDIEIGKVSKSYLNALLKYNSLLKDKNKLLKEPKIDETLLESIDELMVSPIKTIILKREEFFKTINQYITDYYQQIANCNDQIEIIYKKCCELEDVEINLEKSKEKDNYYHYATFGPHHDDYYFKMNNYELNSICSQGQRRMVLIAFKFALIKYIENNTNKTPIVLLDDILSELDQDNQERLLKMLPNNTQVIITNTDINNLNIKNNYKLIELKEDTNV